MSHVTLKEAGDESSLYSTEYGDLRVEDVYLKGGGLPQYLPVGDLWEKFTEAVTWNVRFREVTDTGRQQLFREYMLALGTLDAIGFCPSCDYPDWDDNLSTETEDGWCCDACISEEYTECPSCDRVFRTRNMERNGARTLDERLVCENCIASYYSYCDWCSGYYNESDSDDHDHEEEEGMGCCDSPQTAFRVRNGSELLTNDTRAEIGLPSRISPEGITQIRQLLMQHQEENPGYYHLSYRVRDELTPEWQTREGNFTKRLSKLAYQRYAIKLSPETMSQVGTIARDHSKASSLEVEVTRELNMSADEFGNSGSCWWGSYRESRCALKTNGGFGLRSFSGHHVTGRAWVMPLKAGAYGLEPTFDTESPDAFIVFNGYGDLSGYTPARIVAQMSGWTYAKVSFGCDPMYVNGSNGYLVAPEETIQKKATGLRLSVEQHADLYARECRLALSNDKELAHVA